MGGFWVRVSPLFSVGYRVVFQLTGMSHNETIMSRRETVRQRASKTGRQRFDNLPNAAESERPERVTGPTGAGENHRTRSHVAESEEGASGEREGIRVSE